MCYNLALSGLHFKTPNSDTIRGEGLHLIEQLLQQEREKHGPEAQKHLCPQWLRAAGFDAMMWDKDNCRGGATGCLLHLADRCGVHRGLGSRLHDRQGVLVQKGWKPLEKLQTVRQRFNNATGATISFADVLQAAGAFCVDLLTTNRVSAPDMKLVSKLQFGRPDACTEEPGPNACTEKRKQRQRNKK